MFKAVPARLSGSFSITGAEARSRTADLLFTKQLLYQLSYFGKSWSTVRDSNSSSQVEGLIACASCSRCVIFVEEREGFEPSGEYFIPATFPGWCNNPLCHLSVIMVYLVGLEPTCPEGAGVTARYECQFSHQIHRDVNRLFGKRLTSRRGHIQRRGSPRKWVRGDNQRLNS